MVKKKLHRTQMVPIRLEHELIHQLDILAITQNKYRSELIRDAIRELVTKHAALDKSRTVASARNTN